MEPAIVTQELTTRPRAAIRKIKAAKPKAKHFNTAKVMSELKNELAKPEPEVLGGEIVNRFDYTKIANNDVAAKVQAIATHIRANLRQEKDLRLDTGRSLREAKAVKGFGFFDKWVALEFKFTKRSADSYMALAREFGETYDLVSYLPAQTLYKLAEGKDLKAIRAKVLSEAKAKKPLHKGEVQRLIADTKRTSATPKGKPASKLVTVSNDGKAMSAAREAVALLRERLHEDFARFVRCYNNAKDAFGTALKEAA